MDQDGLSVPRHETTISDETWKALQEWVRDYDHIIPLSVEERRERGEEIAALDARGMRLWQKIQHEWRTDVRTGDELTLMYYSEGLMRYLSGRE